MLLGALDAGSLKSLLALALFNLAPNLVEIFEIGLALLDCS